jgi:hypothetical protein
MVLRYYLIAAVIFTQRAAAGEVPRMQGIPLPNQEISFQRDAEEIAKYHFGPDLRRPFVFPIIGPSGRSLTRMGHPHDPESHSHHNSIWISHNDVNGISFWDDRAKGKIVHRRTVRFEDTMDAAAVFTENAWMASNHVLMLERRLTRAEVLPENEWLLTVSVELQPIGHEVTFGKTPFGLVGVRMAKTIGVNDGGGRILNSEGDINEAGVFWKKARWVDYSGPITASAIEGITLMDHPSNPNHPTTFHVRNDGWMGTSLTFDRALTVQTNQPLKLNYGFYVHSHPTTNKIWRAFQGFAASPGSL